MGKGKESHTERGYNVDIYGNGEATRQINISDVLIQHVNFIARASYVTVNVCNKKVNTKFISACSIFRKCWYKLV